ncbi:hypothetical protein GCK72_007548 [Caenorhabditis remanei]|uniref:Lin-66-like winged helix domain-containing protein n=1 Tax=Caenorhabditis remanei TaxID=31234 RepID=A0A6A5HJD7_CAERE|nr:hypothetical protein GCK72_007548 [Caenorhabditis remanei]KAF1767589.1 hypothetical protein GCK72_007548 [Caenorhabditis remanei]
MNNHYQTNQGMNSAGFCQMFSEHEFPPIGAPPPTKCAATRSPMTSSQNTSDSGVSASVSPATNENSPGGVKPTDSWSSGNYTSSVPPSLNGFGVVTWLSPKAGVITYGEGETIAFQKDAFCDQGVADFTEILRVGMVLSFHGVVHSAHQYSVARVTPLYGEESRRVFANSGEIVLELPEITQRIGKVTYSQDLDHMALQVALEAFLKHGKTRIMFSHFAEHLRNYLENNDLNDYVGMSSMKRRTFLEARTHLFMIKRDDSVALQYPQVYEALYLLNSYLLRHGGTTSLQDLYDFYLSPLIPPHVKNHIGYDRESFWNLIQSHTFVFAIFPGKAYVSARRNLPPLDFTGFLKQNFPGIEQQIVNGNYHQARTCLPSVMDSQYSVPPPSSHSRQYQNQNYYPNLRG